MVLVARTLENLEKVADEIRGSGGTAHVYPCDLADTDAIAEMADRVLADLGESTSWSTTRDGPSDARWRCPTTGFTTTSGPCS